MKHVGIFGGSFNPIHVGHIALAKSLRQQAGLDEVWFLVSPQNPFKTAATDLLDDRLRYQLTAEALKDEPGLVASDYEFRLPKPSYTWHTLQALSHDYPDVAFTLLIGGDNWAAFDKWYHADDIMANYPIVVYPREGSQIKTNSPITPINPINPISPTSPINPSTPITPTSPSSPSSPKRVTIVNTPLLNISSTEIRHRIAKGESIQGLVPDSIAALATDYYQPLMQANR